MIHLKNIVKTYEGDIRALRGINLSIERGTIYGIIGLSGAGTIIGTTSYGKGSVQAVLPLFHEDGLKLTIAKYVTPNGRSIDGTGITPDIVIERSPSDTKDVQFEAAKQYLTEHPSL